MPNKRWPRMAWLQKINTRLAGARNLQDGPEQHLEPTLASQLLTTKGNDEGGV